MVGISASKVGNAICESGSRRPRIHECRLFGGQALTTARSGTSPGTNSTPGMGLIFLRLIFGDALGFCGSSERVDGGGGLDDSSFDRGQRKESIAVESWVVVQVSRGQPARPRDGERYRIEEGEYKASLSMSGRCVSDAWMWEGACARALHDARTTSYMHAWLTHETEPSRFQGNCTCTQHEARTRSKSGRPQHLVEKDTADML